MNQNNTDQKFRKTIRDDIRKINLTKDIRNEYKSLGDFYLNAEKKDELKSMTPVQRWVHKTKWLLKSMFIHLTPLRRLLVLAGILFLIIGRSITFDGVSMTSNEGLLGGILILFVLFLELKDKLLAKHELEAGRKVQRALMPEQTPEFTGWTIWLYTRPANEVGGDLIDYLRLHKDECILTIADVAGKGLKAALLTSKLQATIRALATEINSLADLGKKVNEIFHRDSIASLFASMLIFRVNSNSGKITYVNAGHFAPLIVTDKKIKEHPKGDAALGIIADSEYREQNVTLNTNEIFIAYSDGVFEARNENGEFFGMERFKQLIKNSVNKSPKQIGEYIISQLEKFIGDASATDDISLIIMKRN